MQIKKILGILLMIIFVTSVTAAAASAHDNVPVKKDVQKIVIKKPIKKVVVIKPVKKVVVKKPVKHHKHFHPGHWKKHRVAHKKIINHKVVYVYVIEKVFIKGYWY